jgi:SAM-dependent methyltransferase
MTAARAHHCRSCGGDRLEIVLDLGCTPLANALLTSEQLNAPEATYPLELAFCPDCTLVQILETVPPENLFREYLYLSSWSDTMLAHARALVSELVESRRLHAGQLVMEAASNDGYLLQYYRERGIPVLGIEPARNVADIAVRDRQVPTLVEFFGSEVAGELRNSGRRASVFHAHNVLAHVADLNGFVRGIATVLADDGVAVVEAPYVRDLVDHCEFDTIYHEHLCYFSLTALDALFSRHGLRIHDVRRVAIHGGTLRIYASPLAAGGHVSASVTALLADEGAAGLTTADYYRAFASRVQTLRDQLRATLDGLKASGQRIAAYGASAKGSTLLNYCGIGRERLEYVVDRSTLKQGRYTPGRKLAIHAPARLLDDQPDYLLLLTWNFAEEILAQQAEYRRRGGRFLIPVPEVKVA